MEPSPAWLGDHRAAQGLFPCLVHRDRHSSPARDLLKEGWEAKDSKNPNLSTRGVSQGTPSAGTKEGNLKKADLCQQCPKTGPFQSSGKSQKWAFHACSKTLL